MIVEDEADIGTIVAQMLEPLYEIVRADNGLEALERLNWYEPDITIMDLMMPVLDGFDTTRAIKKDNDYAAMPVLFLTARKDNQSVREALMAGGDVYLEKPFDPPELFVRVSEVISRNNIRAKPKQHTIEEIRAHFDRAEKQTAVVPPPAQGSLSLTEQLARAAAQPRARVLVVSESEQVLAAVKQELKKDYEIIGSSDAEAALDKIAAYQPDVLVLSTRLPTMNAIHFTQLLRVNRQLRVSPVILLAQPTDARAREEAARPGCVLVADEPVDMERLTAQLKQLTADAKFTRKLKRLEYREILRREDPAEDDF